MKISSVVLSNVPHSKDISEPGITWEARYNCVSFMMINVHIVVSKYKWFCQKWQDDWLINSDTNMLWNNCISNRKVEKKSKS